MNSKDYFTKQDLVFALGLKLQPRACGHGENLQKFRLLQASQGGESCWRCVPGWLRSPQVRYCSIVQVLFSVGCSHAIHVLSALSTHIKEQNLVVCRRFSSVNGFGVLDAAGHRRPALLCGRAHPILLHVLSSGGGWK